MKARSQVLAMAAAMLASVDAPRLRIERESHLSLDTSHLQYEPKPSGKARLGKNRLSKIDRNARKNARRDRRRHRNRGRR